MWKFAVSNVVTNDFDTVADGRAKRVKRIRTTEEKYPSSERQIRVGLATVGGPEGTSDQTSLQSNCLVLYEVASAASDGPTLLVRNGMFPAFPRHSLICR